MSDHSPMACPLAFGPFVLDGQRRVLRANGGVVALQPRALAILEVLAERAGRVVTREELMSAVWPGLAVTDANVTVQVSTLRRVLAAHGGDGLIVTVGRGYRFVAEVTRPAAETRAAAAGERLWQARRGVLAALAGGFGTGLVAWLSPRGGPLTLPAHVGVETVPDEVAIRPDGYHRVDYVFTVADPVDLQLESEDIQFSLPNGAAVGQGNTRGRILHGSFAIRGGSKAVYQNNIYLPVDVALAATAAGGRVQLHHLFHLRDPRGREISVPAVLGVTVIP